MSAVVLCVVAPFLAEVLSSNATPWQFVGRAWGLIPVYGFPALLLREWTLRFKISLPGLLVAGFGYGFYNEGLVAKTLFLNHGVPWDTFDGHIGWGGVNWGWLLVICSYHALFSILTPLLLVEKIRPQTSGQTWLSWRSALALFATTLLISTTYHSQKPATLPIGFYLLWLAIGASVLLGSLLRGSWRPMSTVLGAKASSARVLAWIGAFCLPALLVVSVWFAHRLSFVAFVVLWFGIALFFCWNARRGGANGALAMGLGAYEGMSAMNILVGQQIVTRIIGAIAFVLILWWLRYHSNALHTANPT